MAVEFVIPPDLPFFRQRVELDGATYMVRFRWNARADAWSVDVHDQDDTLLAGGLALRAGVPQTAHLRHREGMPPGVLGILDTTESLGDPGLTDLGTRVAVLYLTEDEVEATL